MPVRVVCGEITTGRILADVPTTEGGIKWETVLNDSGLVEATIPLGGISPQRRASLLSYLEPNRCFLAAVTSSGRVMEAGPIVPHEFQDNETKELKVRALGLWKGVLDRRKIVDPAWEAAPGSTRVQETQLAWTGKTLGYIVQQLVAKSTQRPGGTLPIDYATVTEAGAHERTYPGYEAAWLGDSMRKITEVSNGPDVALEPYMTTDGLYLRWMMRTGTEADPLLHQIGDDWRWDRGASRGPLRLLSVATDGSGVGQRAWAIGSGQELDQMIGIDDDLTPTDQGYPLLEVETSSPSTIEQSTLDSQAAAARSVARRPWQTWSIEVRDDVPVLGEYRPGDWASVHIPESHAYLTPGDYRTRIQAISGTDGTKVILKLAPTIERR